MTERSNRPVSRVVTAVADEEGVEPLALDSPLAAVFDPDALEALIQAPTASNLEVRFAYRGHDVVDVEGRVQVC